jgi:hypothetical protein
VGWSDPGEPQAPFRQRRERGAEQAQLADAFMSGQDLDERSRGPSAAGKLGVERGESAGDRRCTGPGEAAAPPDVGAIERERHARHGQRLAEKRVSKGPTDDADTEALDDEIVLARVDDNGLEVGILESARRVAAAALALHGDFCAPRHHDLARRASRVDAPRGVSIENAGIARSCRSFQEVVGARWKREDRLGSAARCVPRRDRAARRRRGR